MERMKSIARRRPVAFSIVILAVSLVYVLLPIPSGFATAAIHELAIAVLVAGIAAFVAVGGAKAIFPSFEGFGYGLVRCIYILIFAALLSLSSLSGDLAEGTPISENLAMNLPLFALLCLSIGVFEEVLFRGLLFGAFLARWGGTRKGILFAALLSSLIFGVAHIVQYVFSGDVSSLASIAQAVGKTVQTGVIGFLFAALYVKTRSLAPIAIGHALFDFIAEFPDVLFSSKVSASYVSSDPSAAAAAAVGYLVVVILLIPAVVIAIRALKAAEVPFYGLFRPAAEASEAVSTEVK